MTSTTTTVGGSGISSYIAYRPADTTLDELIRIAGSRWAVEECFQTAKGECGLDEYPVRRYDTAGTAT